MYDFCWLTFNVLIFLFNNEVTLIGYKQVIYHVLAKYHDGSFVTLVFQVGGIKEKVLAAHCAGMKRIILPKRNEKDLKEVAANVKVGHVDNLFRAVDGFIY